jgi:putative peptide zinc metalloprotease protein
MAGPDLAQPPGAVAPTEVPVPADGVLPLGVSQGSGYRTPPALVRRGDGQILQLSPLLYAVLQAVDGERSYAEVAEQASKVAERPVHADDVRTLVDTKLRPLGLVVGEDGAQPSVRKANPLLTLRPRLVISTPAVTRRVTAPFAVLFTPFLVVPVVAAFAAVTYWVLWHKGLASAARDAFDRPGLLLLVFVVSVLSAGFHEFGHASALRRGGGTPGAMGFGLYLVWPAFYTDVTDAYRLDRRSRIRTDLGGLYFNAIVAVAIFGWWLYAGWDALLLVIATQILQMVRQLPPLLRFDGYHVLADLTGVPDLFHHIGPILRETIPGLGAARRQAAQLKLWVRVVVTLWVLVVVPIMLLTALMAIVAFPRLVATAWHSMHVQWHGALTQFGHGDLFAGSAKLLALAAVIVPVVGVCYMLLRLGSRITRSILRRTEGQPVKRALASACALLLAAALLFLWWPRGNYRPIQPGERGTIGDAVSATFTEPLGAGPARTGLQAGSTLSRRTVWPSGQRLPDAAHKVLAVVLTPRSGNGPTWVFPFNRPPGPGPGDNQTMAVVTKDGGTVYDVSFALVWASGDTVLNKNEAYAFASCTRCTAVAISFQVVLVVGHTSVAAPENIAAAVNYNCVQCVTEALATQLVLTLPEQPTGPVADALLQLWNQIAAFGQNLSGLTFEEIQQRLQQYEQQIIDTLQPYLPSSAPSASTAVTSGGSSAPPAAPGSVSGSSTAPPPGSDTTSVEAPAPSTSGSTAPPSPSDSPSSASSSGP